MGLVTNAILCDLYLTVYYSSFLLKTNDYLSNAFLFIKFVYSQNVKTMLVLLRIRQN